MKTSLRWGLGCAAALLAQVLCGATTGGGGVTFSVTPASISNTYPGKLTFQCDGLTNGETVLVERYLDSNTNGVIDAGDWLVQSVRLTDGQVPVIGGVTNANMTFDGSNTIGAITARVRFQTAGIRQKFVGRQLVRLSSPTERFSALTNTLTVTDSALGQSFSGQVQCGGSPVPFAGVLLLDNDDNPVVGTLADASGNYSVQAPPGTYALWTLAQNYVCDVSTAPKLTLTASGHVTTNLALLGVSYMLSGQAVDAATPSVTLPGMMVGAQSDSQQFVIGCTDSNGNFALPVTAGNWHPFMDEQELEAAGYLSAKDFPGNDTSLGSVSNVVLTAEKGTALIYGTLKDATSTALSGVQFRASNASNNFEGSGTTDGNGRYVLAVQAGQWYVNAANLDRAGYGSLVVPSAQTNVLDAQAVRVDFTGVLGAAVAGQVLLGGVPVANASIQVGMIDFNAYGWNWQQSYGRNTDSNGYFSMTVPVGSNYFLQVYPPLGAMTFPQFYSNAVSPAGATPLTALTNAPPTNLVVNLAAGATVTGRVSGGGNPLQNMDVVIGTIETNLYGGWNWVVNYSGVTDSNGDFNVIVPPGSNYYAQVFAGRSTAWLSQFYGNVSGPEGATKLMAQTNAPTANINFSLQAGSLISGQVLGEGVPLQDAYIEVGTARAVLGGGWNWQYVASVTADSNGYYTLTLPAGSNYIVRANGPSGGTWLEQEYSGGACAQIHRCFFK